MKEIWKDIPNYEGLYQASNIGRTKSLARYIHRGHGAYIHREDKSRKNIWDSKGYYKVTLCKDETRQQCLVHQLVAKTFLPNPNGFVYVDHVNTDRIDNRVENLRWVSCKENNNNPLSLRKHSKVYEGKTLREWHQFCKEIPIKTLKARIVILGWSIKDAISTPVDLANKYKRKEKRHEKV